MFLFFRFPLNDPQRLNLWVQALHRKNFKPTKSMVLCSEHFKETDYLESSLRKNLLKADAVPSIFRFPSYMSKHSLKKRRLLSRDNSDGNTSIEEPVCITLYMHNRPLFSNKINILEFIK